MSARCSFCRIALGERIEGDPEPLIVGEFPEAVAFIPLAPAAWGHTLVIPRIHFTGLGSVFRGPQAAGLFEAIREVSNFLWRRLSPTGMNLIQSTGASAGQTISHLHFHLLPRYDGDHLGDLWAEGREWWREQAEDDGEDLRVRTAMLDAISYIPKEAP